MELERMLEEKDRQFQVYKEGVCDVHVLSIKVENEMRKCRMEVMAKEIEQQMKVLQETKYKSFLERNKLQAENEKLKTDLESQKKLCGRLGEQLERQKYDLMISREGQINKRIKMLQEQEDKNVLEEKSMMSKEQKVEDLSSDGSDDNNELRKESEEKLREDLEYLESLNKTLMIKECMSNRELQDARKELMKGLKGMLNPQSNFCIKRMGEVNRKAFQDICQQKYTAKDWEELPAALCSHWEDCVMDVHWHPFKRITINGRLEEIIDEDDEKLKGLRKGWGEDAYKAVADALLELNEYNPSGRYPVPELWNSESGRRASLKEIIGYIIKQWKTYVQSVHMYAQGLNAISRGVPVDSVVYF